MVPLVYENLISYISKVSSQRAIAGAINFCETWEQKRVRQTKPYA